MRKIITVDNRIILVSLLGIHDSNIKIISKLTGAKIFVKKNDMQIIGSKQSVEKASNIVAKVIDLINDGAQITQDEIEEIASHVKHEKKSEDYVPIQSIVRKGVEIIGKSEGQSKYLLDIDSSFITFCIGPSGTGKTFLAVFKAIEHLQKGSIQKIILVRPAVEAGEKLGYLPGDIEQKFNPYLVPLFDSLNHFLVQGTLRRFINDGIIETAPLAYMRGRTLSDSFVILDEAQNTTPNQMKMFLTRFGENSKFVITGDTTQIDLNNPKNSGLIHAQSILKGIVGISFITLSKDDVVRHPVVHKIVTAYEQKGRI